MRTGPDLAAKLRAVLTQEESALRAISEAAAGARPEGGPGWVRKQELGHLLDSAINNRVRFISAAVQGEYAGPGYAQASWVELGGYAELPWNLLLDFWFTTNELLAELVARIPDPAMSVPCSVSASPSVTLEFLIVDYILHMQHHLDHLLGRSEVTPYPGASKRV